MGRVKREMLPTESHFAVAFALARRGVLTTAEAADIGEYTYHSADILLNRALRVVPVTKLQEGIWMVTDDVAELAERVIPALERLRAEVAATPEAHQFVRPQSRRDMSIIVQALECLLRQR